MFKTEKYKILLKFKKTYIIRKTSCGPRFELAELVELKVAQSCLTFATPWTIQ